MRRTLTLTAVYVLVVSLLVGASDMPIPQLVVEFAPGKNWNAVIVPNGADLDGTDDHASTPDAATFDITGDIEVRAQITPDDNTPSSAMVIASKWRATSDKSWHWVIANDGKLQLKHTTDGSTVVTQKASAATGITDGDTWWAAFTLDVSTGTVTHYWHVTPHRPPALLVDWDNKDVVSGSATSIFSGAADVALGAIDTGGSAFTGQIHEVEIWSVLKADGGTLRGNPRFSDASQWQIGDTGSQNDVQGNTWTLNNNTVITGSWIDITDEVRHQPGFRIRRGRQTPFTRMRPSTLTVTLDNSTGNFDPDNTSGAYTTDLVPMVPIRVKATHNGVTYDLFRGFVTSWTVGQRDYSDTFTQVEAIDGLSLLQLFTIQSPYTEAVLQDSPRSWYRFVESSGTNAVDSSGNARTGTYESGMVGGAAGGPGVISATYTATSGNPGNPDRIQLPSSAGKTGSGDWTVEGWVSSAGSKTVPIFNQFNTNQTGAGGGRNQSLQLYLAADDKVFGLVTNADTQSFRTTAAVTSNAWHHAVMSYASVDQDMNLYLDGALSVNWTGIVLDYPSTNNPFIAFQDDTVFAVGDIAEVALYDSELSAARVLAHFNAMTAPFTGDLTSERITNILDTISWPSADRSLSIGKSTMQGVTSGNTSTLAASFLAQDTEDGEFFVSGDGKVTFKNRHDRNVSAYAAVFANDGSDTPYRDFVWVGDEQLLRNVGQIVDSAATVTESRDDTSVTKYAPRTLRRTSNTADAAEIADYAEWLPAEFGTARRRGLLTLLLGKNGSNGEWAELLSRELGDLVSVENNPVSGGSENQFDFFVEDLNLRGNVEVWTMSLGLSPAVRQRMFTLDDDVLGKLDRDTQGLLGW